ncbi:MAG: 4-hydroxy-tetrahydrodipicolinate reductase [Sandaracinaceae bacterium]|nr:4-hydroxy-tetrahydrodipicolinate reductase [Sandaracinaceae bacterium]
MAVKIAIHGAAGRMGQSIAQVIHETEGAALVAAVDRAAVAGRALREFIGAAGAEITIEDSLDRALEVTDVIIDFTLPDATAKLLESAARSKAKIVIGTTGLTDETEALIRDRAQDRAVVYAPNYSQGVTALFYLAELAAKLMGPAFDAEIIEMHHRMKVDSPSGTALKLLEVVAEAKGLSARDDRVTGRDGQVGARTDREIGVMALRGGDVVGEHTLYLSGLGERLELTHRATDRMIFARGAVRAALFAANQTPGLYDMFDVMGIERS